MALTIDSQEQIDYEMYEENLTKLGFIYRDVKKFNLCKAQLQAEARLAESIFLNKLRIYSKGKYHYFTADSEGLLKTLVELGIPEKRLIAYNSYSHTYQRSLDKSKVFEPLVTALESGELSLSQSRAYALDLIKSYLNYKNLNVAVSGGKNKNKFSLPSEEITKDGKQLDKITFKYGMAATGRHYTSQDNIQGWNKKYVTSITAPKGKFLVWMDFAQIDLRVALNLFIMNESNRKIFEEVEDKYEALAREIYRQLGREFDLDLFKSHRKIYKVLALAKLYNAGNANLSNTSGDKEVVKLLDEFYSKSAKLQKYTKTVQTYINEKMDIDVFDYFGQLRTITSDTPNPLSVFLNTPIQSTSASIMKAVGNKIVERFYALGYTEEQITYYLNRHDEIVFMLDDELKKDLWVLKDCESVFVDDWDVLKLEISIGDYYTEENEEYMTAYENNWKNKLGANLEYQTPRDMKCYQHRNYFPVDDCIVVVSSEGLGETAEELKQMIKTQTVGIGEPDINEANIQKIIDMNGDYFIFNVTDNIVARYPKSVDLEQLISKTHLENVFIVKEGEVPTLLGDTNFINKKKRIVTVYNLLIYLSEKVPEYNKFFFTNSDNFRGWVFN